MSEESIENNSIPKNEWKKLILTNESILFQMYLVKSHEAISKKLNEIEFDLVNNFRTNRLKIQIVDRFKLVVESIDENIMSTELYRRI
jgi:hypothetical protein